jgi:hypothetical protein
MEWVRRRVFERGYWRSGGEKSKEVEVLDASEGKEVTDGIRTMRTKVRHLPVDLEAKQ